MPTQDTHARPPEVRGDFYPAGDNGREFELLFSWPNTSGSTRFEIQYWMSYERRFSARPVEDPTDEFESELPAAIRIPVGGSASDDAIYVLIAIRDPASERWWYVEIAADLAVQRSYAEVAYDSFDTITIRQPMVGGRIGFQKTAMISDSVEIAPGSCELIAQNVDDHATRKLTVWVESKLPTTWQERTTTTASAVGGTMLPNNTGLKAPAHIFAKKPPSFPRRGVAFLYVDLEAVDPWDRVVHWRYISKPMDLSEVTSTTPFTFTHATSDFTRVVSASLLASS